MRGPLVLLTAAVLAGTGCGGDDGGGDTNRQAEKRAKRIHARGVKFQREGRELCRDRLRDVKAVTRELYTGDAVAALRQGIEDTEEFARRLRKLKAPTPSTKSYARRVAANERRNAELARRVVARMEQGVPFTYAVAPDSQKFDRLNERADKLFERLGLSVCTSPQLEKRFLADL